MEGHCLFFQKICSFIAFFLCDILHLPTILWWFYESFTINTFAESIIDNDQDEEY